MLHRELCAEIAYVLVSILDAKAYVDHGLRTVYHRLDAAIRRIFLQDAYMAVIQDGPAGGGSSMIQAMQSLVREKGGWINMAVHVMRCEIGDDDSYLKAWLMSAKSKMQAAASLDMRLFVARALREELYWDAKSHAFTTVGVR